MTEALTQCWFTRIHRPERARHHDEDGSTTSTCRYCHRPIVSWDREAWSLSNGFNVSRLTETTAGRHLTLLDKVGDFVVQRFPVSHLNDEEAIDAFKLELREKYGIDDEDTTLELRDSAGAKRKTVRKVTHAAQDSHRTA